MLLAALAGDGVGDASEADHAVARQETVGMAFGEQATEFALQQVVGVVDAVAHLDVVLQRHLLDRFGVVVALALEAVEHGAPVGLGIDGVGQRDAVLKGAVHALAMERHHGVGGIAEKHGLVAVMPAVEIERGEQAGGIVAEVVQQLRHLRQQVGEVALEQRGHGVVTTQFAEVRLTLVVGFVRQEQSHSETAFAVGQGERRVKMLWQHDPSQPIGVWDEAREDARGLWVKGRLLESTQKGREAAALIAAGAIDGLSIGYRTRKAGKNEKGHRLLTELELWEVSLVTFPMLPSARVAAKGVEPEAETALREIAAAFDGARLELARR